MQEISCLENLKDNNFNYLMLRPNAIISNIGENDIWLQGPSGGQRSPGHQSYDSFWIIHSDFLFTFNSNHGSVLLSF